MNEKSVFRSAIQGDDGQVDSGYLAAYFVMVVVVGAIPVMCIGTLAALWLDPAHKFAVQDLGVGIGAVCAGFGVALAAVGAFRLGDKPRAGTTTTTVAASETTTTAAPKVP